MNQLDFTDRTFVGAHELSRINQNVFGGNEERRNSYSVPSHKVFGKRRSFSTSTPSRSSPSVSEPVEKKDNPLAKKMVPHYNYYQRLDLPHSAMGKPIFFSSENNNEWSVEHLWRNHVELLFSNLKDLWLLDGCPTDFNPDETWSCFKDFAKVRFYCQYCRDGWTSMYGSVFFFYRLTESLGSSSLLGSILYRVCGQKCGKCNPKHFSLPLWYAAEAQKVITNLYYDIANKIDKLVTPPRIKTRRIGTPKNVHEADLCQCCTLGTCKRISEDDCDVFNRPQESDNRPNYNSAEGYNGTGVDYLLMNRDALYYQSPNPLHLAGNSPVGYVPTFYNQLPGNGLPENTLGYYLVPQGYQHCYPVVTDVLPTGYAGNSVITYPVDDNNNQMVEK